MNKQAPTPGRLATMTIFALSCFGLLLFLWSSFGGPVPLSPAGYRVHVDFTEATQLAEQADVRVSGVPVGRVAAIGESPAGGIRAELEIDERYVPLRRDARATLRQKTLLGETYVELTRGSPGAPPLPEGVVLPPGQVRPTVELDEVLRAFDPRTRRDLKTFLAGLAAGVGERGAQLSGAIGSAPAAAEEGADVLGVLAAQRDALAALVRDTGRTFGALGRRRAEVRALVRAGDEALGATARRDEELTRTLRILPTFLVELRRALGTAEEAAGDAAPVLAALRPAAPLVPPVLRDTTALLPDARALLRDLDPALTAARAGLPAARRTLDAARLLMPALHLAARDLRPVVDHLGRHTAELTAAFMNLAAATQDTFRNPGAEKGLHYLRTLIPITNEGLSNQAHRLPSNRHNAYRRARGLDELQTGLESFSCDHLGNLQTFPVLGGTPPCEAQEHGFERLPRDPP